MIKTIKKIISILLVAVMLLSVTPILSLSDISFLNFFSVKADALAASGKRGDNAYWTFDESTGLLRITGQGDMTEYINYPYSPFNNSHIKLYFSMDCRGRKLPRNDISV